MDNAKIHHGPEILELCDRFGESGVHRMLTAPHDDTQVFGLSTYRRTRRISTRSKRPFRRSSILSDDTTRTTQQRKGMEFCMICWKSPRSSLLLMRQAISRTPDTSRRGLCIFFCSFLPLSCTYVPVSLCTCIVPRTMLFSRRTFTPRARTRACAYTAPFHITTTSQRQGIYATTTLSDHFSTASRSSPISPGKNPISFKSAMVTKRRVRAFLYRLSLSFCNTSLSSWCC
jgi:hypothetical protein